MNVLSNIKISKANTLKDSCHISIMDGDKVRYYVSTEKGGRFRLCSCISSYSIKHLLFKLVLLICPFKLMILMGYGKTVQLNLEKDILDYIDKVSNNYFNSSIWHYNVLIGTYDNRQKIVIQCFNNKSPSIFFKVGDENTIVQMQNEINFLKEKNFYSNFSIPEYIDSKESATLKILATKQFKGKRIKPVLNENIYMLFLEISKASYVKDNVEMALSHGDFAPWNIKKSNRSYIIFDWEYCSIRFYGFDLIHFVFQVETLLHGEDQDIALKKAIETSKKYDKKLRDIENQTLALAYLKEREKTYGYIL